MTCYFHDFSKFLPQMFCSYFNIPLVSKELHSILIFNCSFSFLVVIFCYLMEFAVAAAAQLFVISTWGNHRKDAKQYTNRKEIIWTIEFFHFDLSIHINYRFNGLILYKTIEYCEQVHFYGVHFVATHELYTHTHAIITSWTENRRN